MYNTNKERLYRYHFVDYDCFFDDVMLLCCSIAVV